MRRGRTEEMGDLKGGRDVRFTEMVWTGCSAPVALRLGAEGVGVECTGRKKTILLFW